MSRARALLLLRKVEQVKKLVKFLLNKTEGMI